MFGLPDDGQAPADHWLRWLTNSPSKDFDLVLRNGDDKTLSMKDLGLSSLKERGSDNLGQPTTVFLERREVTQLPGDGVALMANKQVSTAHEAGCSNYLLALLAKYGDNIELDDAHDIVDDIVTSGDAEYSAEPLTGPTAAAIGCNEAHSDIQQLPMVSRESLRHEFGSDGHRIEVTNK